MRILKNGVPITSDRVYQGSITSASTTTSFNFNYGREINVVINDQIRIGLVLTIFDTSINRVNISNYNFSYQITSNTAELDFLKQQQELTAGGLVTLSAFVPKLSADVFFKSFITAFNLYVKPSVDDITILEIEPLNDFYNPSGDAIDWSDKIDRSKEITIEPTINFASKNYKFNFTQDNDYWNQRYLNDVDTRNYNY